MVKNTIIKNNILSEHLLHQELEKIKEKISVIKKLTSESKMREFSARELKLLKMLGDGKLTKEEMAKEIGVSQRAISTFKTRLLSKMRVDNLADLILKNKNNIA